MWILTNWKTFAAALATAGIAWLLHAADVNRIEAGWRTRLEDQRVALERKCEADKQLTEENSRAYQTQIDGLARKLALAKRVRPARCVVPTAGEAAGGHGTPAAGELARPDGVSSDALLDFAGTCERLRLQVISLQAFIDRVWEENGKAAP